MCQVKNGLPLLLRQDGQKCKKNPGVLETLRITKALAHRVAVMESLLAHVLLKIRDSSKEAHHWRDLAYNGMR